jgi:hypothetical protein
MRFWKRSGSIFLILGAVAAGCDRRDESGLTKSNPDDYVLTVEGMT